MSDSPASRARPAATERPTRYSARDGAIIGYNLGGWFNRPLYLAHTDAFVLAGDRPLLRFASGKTLHGTFGVGIVRGKKSAWLHAFSDLTFEYRAAHATWIARDRAFPGLELRLEVVGAERGVAFSVRLTVLRARPTDRLVWFYGGAHAWPKDPLNWDLDPHRTPRFLPDGFDPALCHANGVQVSAAGFVLAPAQAKTAATFGQCDATSRIRRGDASRFPQPADLSASSAGTQPLATGEFNATEQPVVHWTFTRINSPAASPRRPSRVAVLIDHDCGSSCEEFALVARQSFQVKLIGRRTYGSLDYSNLRPFELPSGQRRLWYATSRSKRIPGNPVDIAGVPPDIYLPRETGAGADRDEVLRVQRWLEGGSLAVEKSARK